MPQPMRGKDVVLMATVSSFENMPRPSRSALTQFAQLFQPLFAASSDEARRQAAAALAQCKSVPRPVALFVASQPIAIAAPFLIGSESLDDEMLVYIARTQGEAHARAIVRRANLSPTVIDALVGLRHDRAASEGRSVVEDEAREHDETTTRTARDETPAASAIRASITPPLPDANAPSALGEAASRAAREERLRNELRNLVQHFNRGADDRLGLRTLSPVQEALLVRFSRNRETGHFATTLADALSASRWLAERIMLDISGKQLATTLIGTGMNRKDAAFILERLYPHLAEKEGDILRSHRLLGTLDSEQCGERVEAWRRADRYTFSGKDEMDETMETARKSA